MGIFNLHNFKLPFSLLFCLAKMSLNSHQVNFALLLCTYHQCQWAASYLIQLTDCSHIWTSLFSQCLRSPWGEELKTALESLSSPKVPLISSQLPLVFYENRLSGELKGYGEMFWHKVNAEEAMLALGLSTATLLCVSWLFAREWLECLDLKLITDSSCVPKMICLPISYWLVVWTWRCL